MKKILILLLTITTLFTMTACSKKGPEETLSATLDAIKDNDSIVTIGLNFTEKTKLELIEDGTDQISDIDLDDLEYLESLYKKISPVLFEHFDYKIIETKISDDNSSAVIETELTNRDFILVMKDFAPNFISYIFATLITNGLSSEDKSDEELEEIQKETFNKIADLFVESCNNIDEINLKSSKVAIKMKQSDEGKWYIDDANFINYLTADIQDTLNNEINEFNSDLSFE